MLIPVVFVCLLRYAADTIVHDYTVNAQYCNKLLSKARETDVESIRNAYCVEVVEADQAAVLKTLKPYRLAFLASNKTYATFEEVMNYSCRIPSALEIAMHWTAGLIPLTIGAFIFKVAQAAYSKWNALAPQHEDEPEDVSEDESEDNDDAPPKSIRRFVRPPLHKTRSEIRDLQFIHAKPANPVNSLPESSSKPTLSQKTEALISGISPGLRKRILGSEEDKV